jgi:predicted Zn-dependent peptidase
MSYGLRAKQLDAITLEDVKHHYQKTHFARNARFIIAGQMNKWRDTLIERLENLNIASGEAQILLPIEIPESLDAPVLLKNEGVDNVYYRWETAMPRLLTDQERHGLYTMQDMLFATFHSRIFGVARERGLIYGIGANAYRTGSNQVWFVQGQVLPENITPLFELIVSQLEAVLNGELTELEVDGVKQFGLGDFQRAFQTVGHLASWYGQSFVMDDVVRDFNAVPNLIANTNREMIIESARILFNGSQWGLGFLAQKDQKLDVAALQNRMSKLYK